MSIPRKGSRSLTVNDTTYRWVVSVHNNTVNLVVELDSAPGQRLLAYFECRDLYIRTETGEWRFHSQKQSIRPAHVKRLILHALNSGWKPQEKLGKPFTIRNAAQIAATIDVEAIHSRQVSPDAQEAYIKEIARDFLESSMCLSLCMDFEMYDRLLESEPQTRFPIADDNLQQLGLTFAVFLDSTKADGRPVIALQCNEFPDVIEHYWWIC
ncbi:hypothetical protein Pan153_38770 [Gimesia panareensis]|uniref:Uncharacterized protein n=1 Tax=Gimesia panareensis TaxID=2527978 RepID=A0A518FS85_9PLAN|nr:hypothetical protein [Gimesia panareensis]QDV19212.1 hypothetical protein Pan153_38770 [Gimesia panareensis]